MRAHPSVRTGRTTWFLLLVAAVITALLSAPGAQARPASAARTKASVSVGSTNIVAGRQARAERALTRAQDIFDGSRVGTHPNATLALRDLALLRSSLTGAKRAQADRLLARPTDNPDPGGDAYPLGSTPNVTCGTVCVHWIALDDPACLPSSCDDGIDPTDVSPANGIPDYVDTALVTLTNVHNSYVAAGYRAPKSDGSLGGNSLPDIYLANIGPDGLYGYCTSDQNIPKSGPFDVWAYCVLDNDYDPSEFLTNTPIENLQVTAAHEYFHAVQFAYDIAEDGWFMEATATWAEDELYDNVDDNLNYLPSGPLRHPEISLDLSSGLHQYGTWIFFRFLTERFPTQQGGLPSLILDMWKKADGSAGAPDQYSLQAISNVLGSRGSNLTKVFSQFADANRTPAASYSEGAANHYPTAPLAGTFKMSPRKPDTKWLSIKLDHLTSATARFVPSGKLKTLRVKVDMADKVRGSSVIVTTYLKSGGTRTAFISLNSKGDGAKGFPFKANKVKFVEVTLVNASGRFQCWHGSPFSCQGQPKDDGLKAYVRGTASR